MDDRSDCPDCRSAGSMERGVCQVCFAESESGAPANGDAAAPALSFADVVAELDAVASLASLGATGDVAKACRRARALLERLRGQFLAEVILAPGGAPPVPEAGAVAADAVPA